MPVRVGACTCVFLCYVPYLITLYLVIGRRVIVEVRYGVTKVPRKEQGMEQNFIKQAAFTIHM